MADNQRHTTDERHERDDADGLVPNEPAPTRSRLRGPVLVAFGICPCCMAFMDEAGRCQCTD
jgi:hypothetical protein